MAKGFGIAAMIIAIIAIFVPFPVTFIPVVAALALAVIAALAGDRVFATVTAIISALNVVMFSPLLFAFLMDGSARGGSAYLLPMLAALAAPFVAMALNASGKLAFGKKES